MTKITDARICCACSNLVTTDTDCPLCAEPTDPHPQRSETGDYCVDCGEFFPVGTLHLVTWNEDSSVQIEDGELITLCGACREARELESD